MEQLSSFFPQQHVGGSSRAAVNSLSQCLITAQDLMSYFFWKNDLTYWEGTEMKLYQGSGALVAATEEESEGENRKKKCDLHPWTNYFKRRSIFSAVGGIKSESVFFF